MPYKSEPPYCKLDWLNLKTLTQEYIHRVGRTARGEGSSGHALLLLRPEEIGFLRYLKQAKVPLNEFEFSWSKIADIQLQVRAGAVQEFNFVMKYFAMEFFYLSILNQCKMYILQFCIDILNNFFLVFSLSINNETKYFNLLATTRRSASQNSHSWNSSITSVTFSDLVVGKTLHFINFIHPLTSIKKLTALLCSHLIITFSPKEKQKTTS